MIYANFKIKISFLRSRANKTGFNTIIFILIFVGNCLYYNAMHDFTVWLRTSLNPADNYVIIKPYWKTFYPCIKVSKICIAKISLAYVPIWFSYTINVLKFKRIFI